MCEVVGDEDQLFKEVYIHYYDGKLIHDEEDNAFIKLTYLNHEETSEERPVNVFMGVDPASSTRQTADYSTIVPVAIDNEGNRFVLPYYRKRATPMSLAEAIIEYFKIYKPEKVRIESVGYQEMLREYVRARCDEKNIFISGLEIKENPRNSKSARLETMEPYFAQDKFHMRKDMQELKDELLLYPRGKHDDLLDGMYYATKKMYQPFHKKIDKDEANAKLRDKDQKKSWLTA